MVDIVSGSGSVPPILFPLLHYLGSIVTHLFAVFVEPHHNVKQTFPFRLGPAMILKKKFNYSKNPDLFEIFFKSSPT
jgi:hypothetical protein